MSELESNLPEIEKLLLDAAALQSKLEEIQRAGSQVSIQVKGGGLQMAEIEAMELADVAEALQQRKAVQIRYVRDGVLWSDTYAPTPLGIQLVRFALPAD